MALKMTGIATGPLRTFGKSAFVLVVLAGLAGCSGMSSRETTNTAIGAGVGGLGGAILTGGSGWGTAGGAVAGRVLGTTLARKGVEEDKSVVIRFSQRGTRHIKKNKNNWHPLNNCIQ